MDLRSYIELKEAYKKMYSPEEVISEEVEAVEEEILSEEELQENPNTWNNPLGQLSRTATKMFGGAKQIQGVKQNEKDIKAKEDQRYKDGGGDAKVKEFQARGFTKGQAIRGVRNQGDSDRRALQRKAEAEKPKSNYDPRPGGGARDDLARAQQSGGDKPQSQSQSRGLPANYKATEKMSFKKASDYEDAKANAQPKQQPPKEQPPKEQPPKEQPPKQQPPSQQPPKQQPPKTQPAAAKVKQTGNKEKDMKAWRDANPTLANKTKTANPLMKKMGLNKPTPKAAPAPKATPAPNPPKAAPTSGAKAAMNAAPLKSSRLQKALSNIKSVREDYTEFDIIIEHLVEKGFAVEEALKVMVNMSEEKRESIIVERSREFTDARRAQNAAGERGPEFVGPAKAETRNMQNASGARGPEFVRPAKAALGQKPTKDTKPGAGDKGMSPTRSNSPGTPMKEEAMHRDAKTGEVTDKAEVGKTYYPAQPKKKSSVALRKEKEAAEKRKTRKEEDESLMAAYRAVYEPREEISEEDADKLRDQRQERGGVDGNTRYDKAPKFSKGPKKKDTGMSAFDHVVGELKKKYGEDAIKAKKSEKKKED